MQSCFVTAVALVVGIVLPLFKNTPNQRSGVPSHGLHEFSEISYGQYLTFKEIKKFKIAALYLGYLLFYDGVNTVNGIASIC